MTGSTIIAEKDPSRLAGLVAVDDLDDFVCLELEVMTTLDFESLIGESETRWAEDEPIQFDSDNGMAIFKINPGGLAYVLAQESEATALHKQDLRRLREFVKLHGSACIYEFATF